MSGVDSANWLFLSATVVYITPFCLFPPSSVFIFIFRKTPIHLPLFLILFFALFSHHDSLTDSVAFEDGDIFLSHTIPWHLSGPRLFSSSSLWFLLGLGAFPFHDYFLLILIYSSFGEMLVIYSRFGSLKSLGEWICFMCLPRIFGCPT